MKEFGYPEVTAENIITDEVYSVFFLKMLEDNKGYSLEIDEAINNLIDEIESKRQLTESYPKSAKKNV